MKIFVILFSIFFLVGCVQGVVCPASKEKEVKEFVMDCASRTSLNTCINNAQGLYSCEITMELKNTRKWTDERVGVDLYFKDAEKGE
jgi:PBP1b-binding outer membrane lipoprotein LpoB